MPNEVSEVKPAAGVRVYVRPKLPGRRAARRADGDDQDQDAGRADPAAGLSGGGLMKPPRLKLPVPLTRRREPHTLAGAYAMDAISAPDRTRFERHLADRTST